MGSGSFSSAMYHSSVSSRGYDTKSTYQIFSQREVNNAMNPNGILLRESRDSEEHPNSLAIILGLDVTGSMGSIPHHLIKEGLPTIMDSIMKKDIKDPQILFTAIGDHECDSSPFQVAQFESSDELLMHWLENVYLEGGGGGNNGESYLLSWYFAGYRTAIDCNEKRGIKGFLFTVGDEPTLNNIPEKYMEQIFGEGGQYENFSAVQLLDKAKEQYHVYHLHLRQGSNGHRQDVIDGWKQLMGENLIIVDDYRDIPKAIAETIINNMATETRVVDEKEGRKNKFL